MIAGLAIMTAGAHPVSAQDEGSGQVVLDWNANALRSIATAGPAPTTTNVLLAMVHGAIHDAVVSIEGGYLPYLGLIEAEPGASSTAAAAAAAHGVLVGLFPDQSADLGALLATTLEGVPDGPGEDAGIAVGEAAAAAMLAARDGDGRGQPYALAYGAGPGAYRPTPPDFGEYPDAGIAKVRMFLADDATYYRTAGPPALDSAQYAAEYEEVRTLGALEGSTRTPEQEAVAAFWVGAIPQWAFVERGLAAQHGLGIADAARLFAVANLAAGDASVACHEDKYHWMFWRPIAAIHEAETDGNPDTGADPDWAPLGPTPPYPDHPSGFNCYTGAHIGALLDAFGDGEVAFEVLNLDGGDNRAFTSFEAARQEVIDARILQGLHFRTAEVQGSELGLKAAALAAERLAAID